MELKVGKCPEDSLALVNLVAANINDFAPDVRYELDNGFFYVYILKPNPLVFMQYISSAQ